MTNHEFPTGKDPAFLFGCGRFRMEADLLERCAEEILRFGRRPLLVCDDNSHAVAFDKIAASLAAAGAEVRELRHNGFCCRDDALAYGETGALDACADFIAGTKTMKAAVAVDPAAPARLRDALHAIYE